MQTVLPELIFYIFALGLLSSSVLVVTTRDPVKAALYLVACFIFSSVTWLMLSAEFLALTLILVYVGAVMTLFLFVVMMLNLSEAPRQPGFIRWLPVGLVIFALFAVVMIYLMKHAMMSNLVTGFDFLDVDNVARIGQVLYTEHMLGFEIAGLLLLVAIISAITLAFRGKRESLGQNVPTQLAATKSDRLRIIKMPSERGSNA